MILGCFSGYLCEGGLFFLTNNTMMNGDRHNNVLQDSLLQIFTISQSDYFMQYREPYYMANKVMKWLERTCYKSVRIEQ